MVQKNIPPHPPILPSRSQQEEKETSPPYSVFCAFYFTCDLHSPHSFCFYFVARARADLTITTRGGIKN
ncbi:hypothetical protein E2C01_024390 [Portunus trituberculatus]|uniref:Uncharacterized protein n=1 Tax=Portunus trituberculatus TaxID=210409 RepID=A0A5B7EAI6_PORTR|nr:hypothetical protein [Portunus trituberculatus]